MRKQQDTPNNSARFLLSGVRVFLKNTELAHMTIENAYGAISVQRDTIPKTSTHAVGFCVDNDYDGEDEDYDE